MELTKVQERVERTLYEAIRKVAVLSGYSPDITNTVAFGSSPYTPVNQAAWEAAQKAIATAKGFVVDVLGHSQTKGMKNVPRMVLIPRRTLDGDIGAPMQPIIIDDPTSPGALAKVELPLQASHIYIDIHLISNTAAQDRVLHGILSKALGKKRYIPWYDDPDNFLFVRQTSDYDLPDPIEGIEEKVITYEMPDIFEVSEDKVTVAKINKITTEVIGLTPDAIILPDGSVQGGVSTEDGNVVVDGDGITYN